MSPWSSLLARSRSWSVAALLWLILASASQVRADPPATVIWLGGDEAGQEPRARALRLELEAHGITLLSVEAPAPGTQTAEGPTSREALARQTLARTQVDAVLWLEGDPSRPVSWLRIVQQRDDAVQQAPLPHPPEAIEPELFAVAGASLIAQVLREPASAPAAEPQPAMPAQPAQPAEPTQSLDPRQAARAAAPLSPSASAQPRTAVEPRAATTRGPTSPWFVQAGLALSLVQLHSGMEASTRPTMDQIFVAHSGRFYFNETSPWVPDKDSFDDYEEFAKDDMGNVLIDPMTDMPIVKVPAGKVPASGDCAADGIATGPVGVDGPNGQPFTEIEPSKYCARVNEPGFSLEPALRIVLGRWLLPRLAAGVLYQGHFGIDADSFFGNQLFGLQAEYLALGARGRGLALSVLAELDIGRTESTVPGAPRDKPKVNALSGPLGAQAGALLRGWVTSDLALLASATLGARFPATQLAFEPVAGAELSF